MRVNPSLLQLPSCYQSWLELDSKLRLSKNRMSGQRAKGIREGDGLGKGYGEPPGMGILETCGDLGTWMRVSQDTFGSPQEEVVGNTEGGGDQGTSGLL